MNKNGFFFFFNSSFKEWKTFSKKLQIRLQKSVIVQLMISFFKDLYFYLYKNSYIFNIPSQINFRS